MMTMKTTMMYLNKSLHSRESLKVINQSLHRASEIFMLVSKPPSGKQLIDYLRYKEPDDPSNIIYRFAAISISRQIQIRSPTNLARLILEPPPFYPPLPSKHKWRSTTSPSFKPLKISKETAPVSLKLPYLNAVIIMILFQVNLSNLIIIFILENILEFS